MERARPVIDIDEEEEAPHVGQNHALVLVEEDSPSKRAKTHSLASQTAMDQRQLVNLIQSTIQESVALQKAVSSPKAAQSPSSLGSPVSASGLQSGTFDIVIGGWKKGSTRDGVEEELGKLLVSVGVEGDVSQTLLYGKRPLFAKLNLKMESQWGPAQRREFQLRVLTRLREAQWSPGGCDSWITTDKPPKQRRVSKAIAQLNAFLRDQLKVDRALLEVASWASAKAYIREFRVTGRTEENEYGAKPSCDVADLRWLVHDARLRITVWLDLASLALALGMDKAEVKAKWQAHFGGGL